METEKIIQELQFKAVRSSGAGGQNVNKVASKAVLSLDVMASQGLSEDEKSLIATKLANKITADGLLTVSSEEDRSQLRNREIATQKLIALLESALIVAKPRKKTKIPKSVIRKRINDKRRHSGVKEMRRKPEV